MCRESDQPVFTSSDFTGIVFLHLKVVSLASDPNLEDQAPVFMLPSDMLAQLNLQAQGFISVAFYDLQGTNGGIVTRLHAERSNFCPENKTDSS
jgi:hypothetical protein